MIDPTQRFSSYKLLPGDIPALTKPADHIRTVKFNYSNQFATSYRDVQHIMGKANLYFAWAVDADEEPKTGNFGEFNPRGTVHPLPHTRYVFDTVDGGDPHDPEFFSTPYDNYRIDNFRGHFRIINNALSGPPGNLFQDYIRMTIFNDSFDAPMIKPVVS